MKENWPRQAPAVVLDAEAVARLVLPLFPNDSVRGFALVGGGLTNTNYKVTLAQKRAPLLLRLYQRGLTVAQKELAISVMIAPRVPVLRCLYFAESDPVTGCPYAILEWIEAPDFQRLLPRLTQVHRFALAEKIGAVLAAIHSFKFDMFGFFDGRLDLKGPIDFDRGGLLNYLCQTMIEGRGGERLGRELTQDLMAYAERHGGDLSIWLSQPCLVHGDFNAANILVDTDQQAVAAVIDWEYALSAIPAIDFGNLMRPPFDEDDCFADAIAQGYRDAGGFLPEDWRRIAQLADVLSFAEILSQPYAADIVVKDAQRVITKLVSRL